MAPREERCELLLLDPTVTLEDIDDGPGHHGIVRVVPSGRWELSAHFGSEVETPAEGIADGETLQAE
jgi:hypothetical protein